MRTVGSGHQTARAVCSFIRRFLCRCVSPFNGITTNAPVKAYVQMLYIYCASAAGKHWCRLPGVSLCALEKVSHPRHATDRLRQRRRKAANGAAGVYLSCIEACIDYRGAVAKVTRSSTHTHTHARAWCAPLASLSLFSRLFVACRAESRCHGRGCPLQRVRQEAGVVCLHAKMTEASEAPVARRICLPFSLCSSVRVISALTVNSSTSSTQKCVPAHTAERTPSARSAEDVAPSECLRVCRKSKPLGAVPLALIPFNHSPTRTQVGTVTRVKSEERRTGDHLPSASILALGCLRSVYRAYNGVFVSVSLKLCSIMEVQSRDAVTCRQQ